MLLSHELSALHLELRTSTMPGAGKGIFTQKAIGKGEVIGYFYGTLVYNNAPISSTQSNTAMIGEGILQQPLNKFKHWAVNMSVMIPLGRALHSEQTEVWIYPAPFCAMRFVNDGRERNEMVPYRLVPPRNMPH